MLSNHPPRPPAPRTPHCTGPVNVYVLIYTIVVVHIVQSYSPVVLYKPSGLVA